VIASVQHNIIATLQKALNLLNSTDAAVRAPIAVSLGAIPGALSRYYITVWLGQWFGAYFPYGTFFINLTGALIMGFFVTFTVERAITAPELRLLVATGFLGAYTTFSTYALDTMMLLQSGSYWRSLFYWLGSAVFGVVFVELGSFLAKKIP
jgi:CrcB protein